MTYWLICWRNHSELVKRDLVLVEWSYIISDCCFQWRVHYLELHLYRRFNIFPSYVLFDVFLHLRLQSMLNKYHAYLEGSFSRRPCVEEITYYELREFRKPEYKPLEFYLWRFTYSYFHCDEVPVTSILTTRCAAHRHRNHKKRDTKQSTPTIHHLETPKHK